MKRRLDIGLIGVACVLLIVAATAGWSWWDQGIIFQLTRGDIQAAEKVLLVKDFFLSFGVFSPLIYTLFVTIEVVVAPIPGVMLYAPGGIVFGGLLGGALSLIGNVLGAGISCYISRKLGSRLSSKLVETRRLGEISARLSEHGIWVIALLRVNPLTSSDLVSYAAGLTTIPNWKVMLGTAIGMAPLCWVQAVVADNLLTVFPQLIYPLAVACLIYLVVVLWVLRKTLRGDEPQTKKNSAERS